MKAITQVATPIRYSKKWSSHVAPGVCLEWIRIVDFYHACLYAQQLGETIFGLGDGAQGWAKQMRQVLKTKADGVARVLKSASALRRSRGLCGQANRYDKASRYLKSRSQWMRYHLYRRQKLPIGSGITEAACKIVASQTSAA